MFKIVKNQVVCIPKVLDLVVELKKKNRSAKRKKK